MEGGFTNAREDLLDEWSFKVVKIQNNDDRIWFNIITPLFYTGQAIFLALPIHIMCQL